MKKGAARGCEADDGVERWCSVEAGMVVVTDMIGLEGTGPWQVVGITLQPNKMDINNRHLMYFTRLHRNILRRLFSQRPRQVLR